MQCTNCYGKGRRENWRYPATDNFGDTDGEKPEFVGWIECAECLGAGEIHGFIPCPVCKGRRDILLYRLMSAGHPVEWTSFQCPVCTGVGRIPEKLGNEPAHIEDEERKLKELKMLLLRLFGG